MGRRETVARSIVFAILNNKPDGKPPKKPSLIRRLIRLLNLYWLTFELLRNELFISLRSTWDISEAHYKSSFMPQREGTGKKTKHTKNALQPLGDMGYSGSTFFRTLDGRYLVKSVPRGFENQFFKRELVEPYARYMEHEEERGRSSLLVRITDFLQSRHKSLGMMMGLAPSHHIVMENLLYGDENTARGDGQEGSNTNWESWDLKPMSYFFPERDVAGGALASEATKSRLPDSFDDKIYLSPTQKDEFIDQLRSDTKLLADANAVDYSLFLVRVTNKDDDNKPVPALGVGGASGVAVPSSPPTKAPSWRTGISSPDGKQVYRAVILDFFWSKHSMHAMAMTGLINTYNVIDEQGPMSITAESSEYRERFVRMCEDIVQVVD